MTALYLNYSRTHNICFHIFRLSTNISYLLIPNVQYETNIFERCLLQLQKMVFTSRRLSFSTHYFLLKLTFKESEIVHLKVEVEKINETQ